MPGSQCQVAGHRGAVNYGFPVIKAIDGNVAVAGDGQQLQIIVPNSIVPWGKNLIFILTDEDVGICCNGDRFSATDVEIVNFQICISRDVDGLIVVLFVVRLNIDAIDVGSAFYSDVDSLVEVTLVFIRVAAFEKIEFYQTNRVQDNVQRFVASQLVLTPFEV